MGRVAQRLQDGGALARRQVQLPRRTVEEVCCDDAVDLLAEGLDGDLESKTHVVSIRGPPPAQAFLQRLARERERERERERHMAGA